MIRKGGRNLLLYAIILGLMAAGGAVWYISTAEAAANPTEMVVVARTKIPARTLLTEDMLSLTKVPRGAAHPEASASMVPLIGKTTRQSLAPSEQVLASKLFRDRVQTGLSYVLPEGQRAVAITINERTAAGGLILPGDKVDVIGSCLVTPAGASTGKEAQIARTAYTLQNLEVLAVAQDIAGEEAVSPLQTAQANNADNMLSLQRSPSARPVASTVTLSLTPDDSERLILLENHPACTLRLALRSAGDQGKTSSNVVEFNPAASLDPIIGR